MPTVGIRLHYGNNIRVIIRPSGTEPKLKCYIEVISATEGEAADVLATLRGPLKELLNS